MITSKMRMMNISLIIAIGISSEPCFGESASEVMSKFLYQHRAAKDEQGQFVVVTNDSEVITKIRDELNRPDSERHLIINGPIKYGNGGHNLQWHWHFIPSQFNLADRTIEVCDATPAFVEENVEYFVGNVKRYCPWHARPVKELP